MVEIHLLFRSYSGARPSDGMARYALRSLNYPSLMNTYMVCHD